MLVEAEAVDGKIQSLEAGGHSMCISMFVC